MDLPASLAGHLQILCGDAGSAEDLLFTLQQLADDVAFAVPSCRAASLTVLQFGGPLTLSVWPTSAPPHADPGVLASVAVSLAAPPGPSLLLQAGQAGAFSQLVDDLLMLAGIDLAAIVLDADLTLPPATTGTSIAAQLADLAAVNQAIGVLVDRVWEPATASQELEHQARHADTTVAAASRRLLEAPHDPPPAS